jgi:hypothetical protein
MMLGSEDAPFQRQRLQGHLEFFICPIPCWQNRDMNMPQKGFHKKHRRISLK